MNSRRISKLRKNKKGTFGKYKYNSYDKGIRLFLMIILLNLIGVYIQSNNNKLSHMTNGNKSEAIKVLHWNKGPSLFKNKIDHLGLIIDKYKPNIISLSEANYNIAENDQNHQFLH